MTSRDSGRLRALDSRTDDFDLHGSRDGAAARARHQSKQPSKKSRASSVREKKPAQTKEIACILARSGKLSKVERLAAARAVKGTWKNRPEWKGMTSVEVLADIRRRSLKRPRNG